MNVKWNYRYTYLLTKGEEVPLIFCAANATSIDLANLTCCKGFDDYLANRPNPRQYNWNAVNVKLKKVAKETEHSF